MQQSIEDYRATPVEQIPITIPLKLLVETLIRHRDFSSVDVALALYIQQHDPEERICHVEFPAKAGNVNPKVMEANNLTALNALGQNPFEPIVVPRVWYIKNWRESYERAIKLKQESNDRALAANLRSEKIQEVKKALLAKLPTIEDETAYTVAQQIVESNNVMLAQQFGVMELL